LTGLTWIEVPVRPLQQAFGDAVALPVNGARRWGFGAGGGAQAGLGQNGGAGR
jgi:hypothetical protein